MINYEVSHQIKDLIIFKPEIYYDFRGTNCETFNDEYLDIIERETMVKLIFPMDTQSDSYYGVLRGFHSDLKNYKLVKCVSGSVHCIIIDNRLYSPTYKNVFTINLNDSNKYQVLVPRNCLNAYQCLSDKCIYYYKYSYGYLSAEHQITKKWNDIEYNVHWPIQPPILAERDK